MKTKIFEKKLTKDKNIVYFLFGKKFFSYKSKTKFHKIYSKRFKELSIEEKKFILETVFEERVGYKPDIDNPKTFNEKIQWLKLYYHNSLMTKCADKYLVREYVKEKIGEEYLIPLLGVYNTPDEINFDDLPNQFVLKVNWGSGQNIIVKDKSKLNIKQTKLQLKKWLHPYSNHYYNAFEWCYKDIKPKIIVEKYMKQLNNDLYDYKFLVYNGQIKNLFVVSDRFNNKYVDWYDKDYNFLNFTRGGNNSPNRIIKPKNFDKLKLLAKKLAEDFLFVRVDFYSVEGKIYFGELTFYPGNGMEPFEPLEWDYKLGEMLELPIKGEYKCK